MTAAPRVATMALLLLASLVVVQGWGAWIDPLVDFGRELYVPWRLAGGEVLYRDIAYLDGPLSPYGNALLFTLLPVSLRTLELANLAVVATTSLLLFALLRRLGEARTGFVGVAAFLGIFAFNRIGMGGNMNWVAPYSHGVTHGVALALAALWLLARHQERGTRAGLVWIGLAVGLAALTKPEILAATGAAVAVGLGATWAGRAPEARPRAIDLGVLAGATALPFLLASLLLATAMPADAALRGALGGWPHLLGSDVGRLHFYRWLMGLDEPARNLAAMAGWTFAWSIALVPAAVLAARPGRGSPAIAAGVAVATGIVALLATGRVDWGEAFRPLTAFAAASLAMAGVAWRRARGGPDGDRAALALALAVLALALLAKVVLQPVLWGYAFALGVPAMATLVLALDHGIPAFLARRGGHAWTFRGAALAVLLVAVLGCLGASERMNARKDLTVGRGGDAFRTGRLGNAAGLVGPLVEAVEAHVPPDATLVVMPEGVMINYLTRRRNPTPHLNFVPPEIAIFGEARILADLRAADPDYVVLVHRETREYGLPLFGTDYAESLLRWARDEHELVARAGATPLAPERLRDGRTGFEIRARPARAPREGPAPPRRYRSRCTTP